MTHVQAKINPEALEWARNRARYNEATLAKRVGVSLERYREWESGDSGPTIRQLRTLVRALNEPLQTFFMSTVPDEPEVLAEMRRLPGYPIGEESPGLAAQVRLSTERREIALRLYEALAEQPPYIDITAGLDQDPESLAQMVRGLIGVSVEEQASWDSPHHALRQWRSGLEKAGVLVFQAPQVSIHEMRGFSFALRPLPIIGVNSKDSATGRVFTIFHELIHLLLGDTVLETADYGWFQINPKFHVEHFCNKVAAAALAPTEDVYEQAGLLRKDPDDAWIDREVRSLADRYKVSRAVVIRRLRSLQLISDDSYEDLRPIYDAVPVSRVPQKGGDFYANVLSRVGTLIPRLAFRAYYDNRLTVSDLSSLLGLKVKNLGRLEERVFGFNYGFGG